MKQFNLNGKSIPEAFDFYMATVVDEINRFRSTHNGVVNYSNLSSYIESHHEDNPKLFVPVTKLDINNLDKNLTIAEAKKIISQNKWDLELYNKVKNLPFYKDVVRRLIPELVRQEFPERKLSYSQVTAITEPAYMQSYQYGMLEVIKSIANEISIIKNFED